ncbi:MAG: hypothetical protein KDE04_08425, partial [Anaerolineales bacterium]|nr:hypothetical protein [Anaerolineales bacterium]
QQVQGDQQCGQRDQHAQQGIDDDINISHGVFSRKWGRRARPGWYVPWLPTLGKKIGHLAMQM